MKIIDDAQLQRLEELEKWATKTPWSEDYPDIVGDDGMTSVFDFHGTGFLLACDSSLIVESRNALPLLLDSVRRLKEALAIAREWTSIGGAPDEDVARIRELVGE